MDCLYLCSWKLCADCDKNSDNEKMAHFGEVRLLLKVLPERVATLNRIFLKSQTVTYWNPSSVLWSV